MSVAPLNTTTMMKLSSPPPQTTPLGGATLSLRREFGSERIPRGALSLSLYNPITNSNIRRKKKKSSWVVASQVNSSGSIDSPLMQSMHDKIKEQLNAETVVVKDAYGDGRHVSIDVISSAFEGQSAVNRQRMVYQAIREEIGGIVHAVDQMTTKTPAEAANN